MSLTVMPLNGKRPALKSWKELQTKRPTIDQVRAWQGYNVGLLMKGISAVDFDDKEAARTWFAKHRDIITCINETKRGVHFLFAGETATRKFEHGDIKGQGSYIVVPDSIVEDWTYRWVDGYGLDMNKLKPFPEELFPNMAKEQNNGHAIEGDAIRRITRARAYAQTCDPAIEGQGGDNWTYRVACKLIDFGLTVEQAWPIFLDWNSKCVPPWDHKRLLRKLREAERRRP